MGFFGKRRPQQNPQQGMSIDELVMRDKERKEELQRKYEAACAEVSDAEVKMARFILTDLRITAANFRIVQKPGGSFGHEVLCLQSTRPGEEEKYFIEPTRTERPTLHFATWVMTMVERREVTDVLKRHLSRIAAVGKYYGDITNDMQERIHLSDDRSYRRTHAGLQQFLFDLNAMEVFQKLCQTHQADFQRLNWHALKGDHKFYLYMDQEVKEFLYNDTSLQAIDQLVKEHDVPSQATSGSQDDRSGSAPEAGP